MDPSSSSYSVWNDFFLLAGIPNAVANEYAVTFSQHRIRIDMLKEITKEILLDMGIKAMGDIIAILRHAKNLTTQDELKVGVKRTTCVANSLNAPATSINQSITPSVNHLAQRTPITTTRSGPSISSLVGNKIQSRVSQNSGALAASSHTAELSKSKRPSSTISSSLAKRLRPADETVNERSRGGINLPEKTLTVHYPSSSAIARAQQRVLTNSSSGPVPARNSAPVSIKSRLGTSPADGSRHRSETNTTNHSHDKKNWSNKNQNGNGVKINTPNNSGSKWSEKNRRHENFAKKDDARHQPGRLKSVFHRLGEGAR